MLKLRFTSTPAQRPCDKGGEKTMVLIYYGVILGQHAVSESNNRYSLASAARSDGSAHRGQKFNERTS